MVDFKNIAEDLLTQAESLVPQWFPNGKRNGKEWQVGSIDGEAGKSLSINLQTGKFADFATGLKGGDLISLYAAKKNISQAEAAKELGADIPDDLPKKPKLAVVKEELLFPVTKDINFTVPYHPKYGEHERGPYIYRDFTGNVFGGVVFYRNGDGKKEALPIVFSKTKKDWIFKGFPEPRPLYNLERFKGARQIVIVEGEPCADAAQRMIPGTRVTTWQGGAKAVSKTNWKPCAGVPVVIWRDNDTPGKDAEKEVCTILLKLGCKIQILNDKCLKDKEEGWDVADAVNEGWDQERILKFLKDNLVQYTDTPRGGARQEELPPDAGINTAPLNKYFKELGLTGNNQYGFYNYTSGMIHKADIKLVYDKKFLTSLTGGDPYYWTSQTEANKEGERKVNWAEFACKLITKCQLLQTFDYAKVRGLGTWEDNGNFVVNAGKDFYVNNKKVHFYDYDSRHIYTARTPVDIDVANPLTIEEMRFVRDMCAKIRWIDQETMMLFSGWLVAAPLGQTLVWRSHIYLQGPSGTGKSWVLSFMRRILGNFQYGFTMATTAPGVRRKNDNGSVPILFDEAELKEASVGESNQQKILELARIGSRNDGMGITLGKSGGGTEEFTMQNCFCFASIISSVTQYQDETRITILAMKEKRNESDAEAAKFAKLEEELESLANDFSARYLGWCILNAPKIQQNILTFYKQAKRIFKSNRHAEQLAMMLGGYYSVESDEMLTDTEAAEIIETYEWKKLLPSEELTTETRILDAFNAAQMEVEVRDAGNIRVVKRSLRALVAILLFKKHPAAVSNDQELHDIIQPGDINLIDEEQVEHLLSSVGIVYDTESRCLSIATASKPLSTLLRGTVWINKWSPTLRNIPGVFEYRSPQYFKLGRKRALGVPVKAFLDFQDIPLEND